MGHICCYGEIGIQWTWDICSVMVRWGYGGLGIYVLLWSDGDTVDMGYMFCYGEMGIQWTWDIYSVMVRWGYGGLGIYVVMARWGYSGHGIYVLLWQDGDTRGCGARGALAPSLFSHTYIFQYTYRLV